MCRGNLRRLFLDRKDSTIYDHLNSHGTPDAQVRPNQIFAAPLFGDTLRARILKTVINHLTYEYGVASLSQDDDNFHPFHQYAPFYPKDAAYHNGAVWTWLQGTVISELCHFGKQEFAYRITANAVHHILERGAVGTQSELLDAVPRSGDTEPQLSGTFSQAWSLAEFVRNFYDDYLGVRISNLRHVLALRPNIPSSLGDVRAVVILNGSSVPIEIRQNSGVQSLTINSQNLNSSTTALVDLSRKDGMRMQATFVLPPKVLIRVTLQGSVVTVTRDGSNHQFSVETVGPTSLSSVLEPLKFVTPSIRPGLRSMRGPAYPLLTHSQAKAMNPSAKILVEAVDPAGDDVGVTATGLQGGGYVYPANSNFAPGSFDITGFTVSYDASNVYFSLRFKTLSNPGWHPEYGFQLTYAAIAIDEDGKIGSGSRDAGHNSHYVLDERHAYERLILIGGGVQLEDSKGTVLAAYIPGEPDVADPLGHQETGTVSFAIPLTYIGRPASSWTFTILAGAQDDHGGAGIGEFRTVNREVGEWNGGGKPMPVDPNIYDILVAPQR
jgi:hypothetical protein